MQQEEEILAGVISSIQAFAGKAIPINAETNILRDLNFDSLAVMDFIMQIETQFNTIIPVNRLAEIETISDLVGILSMARQAA